MFLVGLNKNWPNSWSETPFINPRSNVIKGERKKKVIFGDPETSSKPRIENSAMVSRGLDFGGERRKKPWCDHRKKPSCWNIHWKPYSKKCPNGRALQTLAKSS